MAGECYQSNAEHGPVWCAVHCCTAWTCLDRLTAALEHETSWRAHHKTWHEHYQALARTLEHRAEQAEAEVDQLRQQLTEAQRDMDRIQQDNLAQYDRATRAETEAARLRAALASIAARALADAPDDVRAAVASGRTINAMYGLAKAALTPPEAPGAGGG